MDSKDKNKGRFLMSDDGVNPYLAEFVYRPPGDYKQAVIDASLGYTKFAQKQVILDDWWLFGGTRWSRTVFRLKHPVVYLKRGFKNFFRKIKYLFVKPKTIQPLANHPYRDDLERKDYQFNKIKKEQIQPILPQPKQKSPRGQNHR